MYTCIINSISRQGGDVIFVLAGNMGSFIQQQIYQRKGHHVPVKKCH